jgi:hypothetical protein
MTPQKPKRPGGTVRVDQVLPYVLKSFGIPSQNVTRQVLDAWERAADERWRSETTPHFLSAGVLVIGVTSSALRQELQEFHRERLLQVMKAALPKVPIVKLHFVEARQTPPAPPPAP